MIGASYPEYTSLNMSMQIDARVSSPQVAPKQKVSSPQEAPKQVSSPQEAPKQVSSLQEAPKQVSSPQEAPKQVSSLQEAPKQVSSPQEAPKQLRKTIQRFRRQMRRASFRSYNTAADPVTRFICQLIWTCAMRSRIQFNPMPTPLLYLGFSLVWMCLPCVVLLPFFRLMISASRAVKRKEVRVKQSGNSEAPALVKTVLGILSTHQIPITLATVIATSIGQMFLVAVQIARLKQLKQSTKLMFATVTLSVVNLVVSILGLCNFNFQTVSPQQISAVATTLLDDDHTNKKWPEFQDYLLAFVSVEEWPVEIEKYRQKQGSFARVIPPLPRLNFNGAIPILPDHLPFDWYKKDVIAKWWNKHHELPLSFCKTLIQDFTLTPEPCPERKHFDDVQNGTVAAKREIEKKIVERQPDTDASAETENDSDYQIPSEDEEDDPVWTNEPDENGDTWFHAAQFQEFELCSIPVLPPHLENYREQINYLYSLWRQYCMSCGYGFTTYLPVEYRFTKITDKYSLRDYENVLADMEKDDFVEQGVEHMTCYGVWWYNYALWWNDKDATDFPRGTEKYTPLTPISVYMEDLDCIEWKTFPTPAVSMDYDKLDMENFVRFFWKVPQDQLLKAQKALTKKRQKEAVTMGAYTICAKWVGVVVMFILGNCFPSVNNFTFNIGNFARSISSLTSLMDVANDNWDTVCEKLGFETERSKIMAECAQHVQLLNAFIERPGMDYSYIPTLLSQFTDECRAVESFITQHLKNKQLNITVLQGLYAAANARRIEVCKNTVSAETRYETIVICLRGPACVGKTRLARALADRLGRKYFADLPDAKRCIAVSSTNSFWPVLSGQPIAIFDESASVADLSQCLLWSNLRSIASPEVFNCEAADVEHKLQMIPFRIIITTMNLDIEEDLCKLIMNHNGKPAISAVLSRVKFFEIGRDEAFGAVNLNDRDANKYDKSGNFKHCTIRPMVAKDVDAQKYKPTNKFLTYDDFFLKVCTWYERRLKDYTARKGNMKSRQSAASHFSVCLYGLPFGGKTTAINNMIQELSRTTALPVVHVTPGSHPYFKGKSIVIFDDFLPASPDLDREKQFMDYYNNIIPSGSLIICSTNRMPRLRCTGLGWHIWKDLPIPGPRFQWVIPCAEPGVLRRMGFVGDVFENNMMASNSAFYVADSQMYDMNDMNIPSDVCVNMVFIAVLLLVALCMCPIWMFVLCALGSAYHLLRQVTAMPGSFAKPLLGPVLFKRYQQYALSALNLVPSGDAPPADVKPNVIIKARDSTKMLIANENLMTLQKHVFHTRQLFDESNLPWKVFAEPDIVPRLVPHFEKFLVNYAITKEVIPNMINTYLQILRSIGITDPVVSVDIDNLGKYFVCGGTLYMDLTSTDRKTKHYQSHHAVHFMCDNPDTTVWVENDRLYQYVKNRVSLADLCGNDFETTKLIHGYVDDNHKDLFLHPGIREYIEKVEFEELKADAITTTMHIKDKVTEFTNTTFGKVVIALVAVMSVVFIGKKLISFCSTDSTKKLKHRLMHQYAQAYRIPEIEWKHWILDVEADFCDACLDRHRNSQAGKEQICEQACFNSEFGFLCDVCQHHRHWDDDFTLKEGHNNYYVCDTPPHGCASNCITRFINQVTYQFRHPWKGGVKTIPVVKSGTGKPSPLNNNRHSDDDDDRRRPRINRHTKTPRKETPKNRSDDEHDRRPRRQYTHGIGDPRYNIRTKSRSSSPETPRKPRQNVKNLPPVNDYTAYQKDMTNIVDRVEKNLGQIRAVTSDEEHLYMTREVMEASSVPQCYGLVLRDGVVLSVGHVWLDNAQLRLGMQLYFVTDEQETDGVFRLSKLHRKEAHKVRDYSISTFDCKQRAYPDITSHFIKDSNLKVMENIEIVMKRYGRNNSEIWQGGEAVLNHRVGTYLDAATNTSCSIEGYGEVDYGWVRTPTTTFGDCGIPYYVAPVAGIPEFVSKKIIGIHNLGSMSGDWASTSFIMVSQETVIAAVDKFKVKQRNLFEPEFIRRLKPTAPVEAKKCEFCQGQEDHLILPQLASKDVQCREDVMFDVSHHNGPASIVNHMKTYLDAHPDWEGTAKQTYGTEFKHSEEHSHTKFTWNGFRSKQNKFDSWTSVEPKEGELLNPNDTIWIRSKLLVAYGQIAREYARFPMVASWKTFVYSYETTNNARYWRVEYWAYVKEQDLAEWNDLLGPKAELTKNTSRPELTIPFSEDTIHLPPGFEPIVQGAVENLEAGTSYDVPFEDDIHSGVKVIGSFKAFQSRVPENRYFPIPGVSKLNIPVGKEPYNPNPTRAPPEVKEKLVINNRGNLCARATQSKQWEGQDFRLTPALRRHVIAELEAGLSPYYTNLRPLTEHEVLNGLGDGGLNRMVLNKAIGWTMSSMFRVTLKSHVISFSETTSTTTWLENEAAVWAREWFKTGRKLIAAGKRPWTCFLETVKMEKLKPAKKFIGRIFCAEDLHGVLWERTFLGDLISRSTRLDPAVGVGIDHRKEFDKIVQNMLQKGLFYTGDYARWDKTVQRELFDIFAQSLGNLNPEMAVPIKTILNMICTSVEISGRTMFVKRHGMPSGTSLTANLNSKLNELLVYVCYCYAGYEILHYYPTWRQFKDEVYVLCYGDDLLVAVNNDAKWFDLSVLATCAKNIFNMNLDSSTKDGLGEKRFETLEEMSWISRFFRKLDRYPYFVGALKKDTIWAWLNWTKDLHPAQVGEQLTLALIEAANWDVDFFNQIFSAIQKILKLNPVYTRFTMLLPRNYIQREAYLFGCMGASFRHKTRQDAAGENLCDITSDFDCVASNPEPPALSPSENDRVYEKICDLYPVDLTPFFEPQNKMGNSQAALRPVYIRHLWTDAELVTAIADKADYVSKLNLAFQAGKITRPETIMGRDPVSGGWVCQMSAKKVGICQSIRSVSGVGRSKPVAKEAAAEKLAFLLIPDDVKVNEEMRQQTIAHDPPKNVPGTSKFMDDGDCRMQVHSQIFTFMITCLSVLVLYLGNEIWKLLTNQGRCRVYRQRQPRRMYRQMMRPAGIELAQEALPQGTVSGTDPFMSSGTVVFTNRMVGATSNDLNNVALALDNIAGTGAPFDKKAQIYGLYTPWLNTFVSGTQSSGSVIAKVSLDPQTLPETIRTWINMHDDGVLAYDIGVFINGTAGAIGTIRCGWVKDISLDYSLEQLMGISSQDFSLSTTSSSQFVLRDVRKNGLFRSLRDDNEPWPGLIFMVSAPITNVQRDAVVQYPFQIYVKLNAATMLASPRVNVATADPHPSPSPTPVTVAVDNYIDNVAVDLAIGTNTVATPVNATSGDKLSNPFSAGETFDLSQVSCIYTIVAKPLYPTPIHYHGAGDIQLNFPTTYVLVYKNEDSEVPVPVEHPEVPAQFKQLSELGGTLMTIPTVTIRAQDSRNPTDILPDNLTIEVNQAILWENAFGLIVPGITGDDQYIATNTLQLNFVTYLEDSWAPGKLFVPGYAGAGEAAVAVSFSDAGDDVYTALKRYPRALQYDLPTLLTYHFTGVEKRDPVLVEGKYNIRMFVYPSHFTNLQVIRAGALPLTNAFIKTSPAVITGNNEPMTATPNGTREFALIRPGTSKSIDTPSVMPFCRGWSRLLDRLKELTPTGIVAFNLVLDSQNQIPLALNAGIVLIRTTATNALRLAVSTKSLSLSNIREIPDLGSLAQYQPTGFVSWVASSGRIRRPMVMFKQMWAATAATAGGSALSALGQGIYTMEYMKNMNMNYDLNRQLQERLLTMQHQQQSSIMNRQMDYIGGASASNLANGNGNANNSNFTPVSFIPASTNSGTGNGGDALGVHNASGGPTPLTENQQSSSDGVSISSTPPEIDENLVPTPTTRFSTATAHNVAVIGDVNERTPHSPFSQVPGENFSFPDETPQGPSSWNEQMPLQTHTFDRSSPARNPVVRRRPETALPQGGTTWLGETERRGPNSVVPARQPQVLETAL